MVELVVDLHGTRVGVFRGADWAEADLALDEDALDRWGEGSPVLSVALPLQRRGHRGRAGRRRTVLAEALPEGHQRTHLADWAGVGRLDQAGLLARWGRDLPGAAQVHDPHSAVEPAEPAVLPLSDDDLHDLVAGHGRHSLGNDRHLGRSSLAGLQPKLALVRTAHGWARPVGGAASTHLVKPATEGRPVAIAEEELGNRLARRLGLSAFACTLEQVGGRPALVQERFDRVAGCRVHQEDLSQALGIRGGAKYQEHGGLATLVRVAHVVGRYCPPGSLATLLRLVTFTVGVGNLDLHTKNVALLHDDVGGSTLAPAYDVVPMAHWPGMDLRLAMSVNDAYEHPDVTAADLVAEGERWGVPAAAAVVADTLEELRAAVAEEQPAPGAEEAHRQITHWAGRLLAGRPAGAAPD